MTPLIAFLLTLAVPFALCVSMLFQPTSDNQKHWNFYIGAILFLASAAILLAIVIKAIGGQP
jgi:hypothetical protein